MKIAEAASQELLDIDFSKFGHNEPSYYDEPSPLLLPKIKGSEASILPLIPKPGLPQNKIAIPVGSFISKYERQMKF